MSITATIVTCVYNPDLKVFAEVLESVQEILRSDAGTEYILVENGPESTLRAHPPVQKLLESFPGQASYLLETRQGLSYARSAGGFAARGGIVVWCDDDNVPDSDYVRQARELFARIPEVGAWGPGRIEVVLPEDTPAPIRGMKYIFQERDEPREVVTVDPMSPDRPFGTGLVVCVEAVRRWATNFLNGAYTMKGRTGNAPTAGEDMQLIDAVLRLGLKLGSSPKLRLRHVIFPRRLNEDYIKAAFFSHGLVYYTMVTECGVRKGIGLGYALKKALGILFYKVKGWFVRDKLPPACSHASQLGLLLGWCRGKGWRRLSVVLEGMARRNGLASHL